MTDAVETPAVCASCDHPLAGSYCARCGEPVLDPAKLTLRYFLTHTVVHELLSFDSKIWRTLGLLLFRPGFLALEYAAGRRRAYINPMRVFLVSIVVYVLALGGSGFTIGTGGVRLSIAPAPVSPERSVSGTFFQTDRFGVLERMFVERFGSPESASTELRSRFNRMLNVFSTPLSFTAVFLVALTLYAGFRRRRRLLVEHVVFAMHYYSFALLTLLLVMLAFRLNAGRLGNVMLAVLPLVMIWQIAYLARAIRRFYFATARSRAAAWTVSAVAAPVVYLLNSLFITVLQFAGAAFAITRL